MSAKNQTTPAVCDIANAFGNGERQEGTSAYAGERNAVTVIMPGDEPAVSTGDVTDCYRGISNGVESVDLSIGSETGIRTIGHRDTTEEDDMWTMFGRDEDAEQDGGRGHRAAEVAAMDNGHRMGIGIRDILTYRIHTMGRLLGFRTA